MSYLLVVAFVLAIIMGRIIIPHILLIAFKKRLFDAVNVRKVHSGVIPRLGGVSFLPTQCCLLILSFFIMFRFDLFESGMNVLFLLQQFLLLMCGLILLFIVGLADDLIGINYRWKLVIQVLAASLLPLSGLWVNNLYGLFGVAELPEAVGIPLTVLIIVFIINSVNLIDGIDGLCSGIIVLGCSTMGFLFAFHAAWLHALFAFITAGVLLPFFYYNVFGKSGGKHRIFMGDAGSLTLGLSVSFLAISYAMYNPEIKPFSPDSILVAFATLIIPMFDVIRVVWVRWRLNKSPFMPDRNHLHHKFLRAGASKHQTMIAILFMASLYSLFNIVATKYISSNIVLLIDLAIWIAFHVCFDRMEALQFRKRINNQLG